MTDPIRNMYFLNFNFNKAANEVFGANIWHVEFKTRKDTLEYTVFWRDTRNHRVDVEYDVSTHDLATVEEMVKDLEEAKADILEWEHESRMGGNEKQ